MSLLIVLFAVIFLPLQVLAQGPSGITADAFLLVEKDTFTVIAGKDYNRELPPASTTKVLTSILALEKLRDGDTVVPTRKVLALPNSKMNLAPGQPYRAMDLVTGALVESANDAALALSEAVAGSEERFASMMNQKAREIGAENTNFRNASGLSAPGQYTTCWDLALILRYALDNPRFKEIIRTKYFLFNAGQRDVRYRNHNRFLFCFEPAIGGKTGFTRASMHTYVGAFEKDGKVYILSLLKSRNLWGDAVNVLKYVYNDVPTDREIRLARAGGAALTCYRVEKPAVVTAKKTGKRKAVLKAAKKGKKKTALASRKNAKPAPTLTSSKTRKKPSVTATRGETGKPGSKQAVARPKTKKPVKTSSRRAE